MREKLAYVQTIKALKPIVGADKIECAEVLGWEVVVKKGEVSVGDKIVYVEIDAIMPELPPFEFLRSRKFRIRTCKLRNQISQGIVFPLSIINEVDPTFDISKLNVNDDVTEILRIVKYDPEAALDIPAEPPEKLSWFARRLRWLKWKLFGFKPIKYTNFPPDVPKTDETRVQHMQSTLERNNGIRVYLTEKCEGTSATFVYRKNGNWIARLFGKGYTFQVCSRNRVLYSTDKSGTKPTHPIMAVAERYDILNNMQRFANQGVVTMAGQSKIRCKMKRLNRNIAIQGEVIGPKIQANPYRLDDYEFRVFRAYDIDKHAYVHLAELLDIVEQCGLTMVPILGYDVVKPDIRYWVELSKGKSKINPKTDREGIVVRVVEGNFSFKSINPDYLLRQDV